MQERKRFLFLLLILTTPLLINSQNRYNLNFDDYNPDIQEMPEGWFKWGSFETLTGEVINGNNSVGKIVSDKNGEFGCITYRIPAKYVGETIKLSGKIKFENVKGFVGLLMKIDGKSKQIAFNSMEPLKIRGSSDWKEYSIEMPLPTNAKTIYIGGILGERGVAWFDDFKVTIDGKDIQRLEEVKKSQLEDYNPHKLESAISKSSTTLDFSNEKTIHKSLDSLIEEIGHKRIVAIGESTHGTSEFYQLREIITKRLILEKGFNLVVLENPYDDIEILNQGIYNEPLESLMRKHLFPIYQTREMKSFLEWYKDKKPEHGIEFKGSDDSHWVFQKLLKEYCSSISDKKLNKLLNKIETSIAKRSGANLRKEFKINASIYENILAIENYLNSTNNLTEPLEEILFNAKNTYSNFANAKNKKTIQSRDELMAQRISYLAKDIKNKIIVWAHNAHISNQIITGGEIGIMGRDLKKEFGNNYHTIGLTTLKGNYSYIDEGRINSDHNYKEQLKTASIKENANTLWENTFAQHGKSFYINISNLTKKLKTEIILGPTKFIGYSKESDENEYHLPLLEDFDSLIFIEETNSTKPIF